MFAAGATTITNDVFTNTGGLLTVEGTLNLDTTTIIGGTITGSGGSDLIDVTGDSKIDGSAALNTANVTVDATKTLTLDDVTATTDAFTDTGTFKVEGTQKMTLKAVDSITNGAITNLGTIDVFAAGATTITNDVFTNTGGLLTVEGTLNLDTTTIIGGTITGSGGSDLIDVTGDSKIDGSAALNTANVTVDATKTLTLDDVTATTDAFTDTGTIQVEGTHTLTLKAVDSITNGAITNLGTIDVFAAGATTITNDVFTNTGGLLTVEGTLNLDTTTIIGGTITGSGGSDLIDVTGDSKIDGSAALNTANVTVDATKTLTLDDVTATTDAFTDTGTIQVEGTHTLTLKAVDSITNGAITNLGTIDVFAAGATTITNDVFTNTGGLLTVEGTLNLDTTTIIGGTITGSGGSDLIDVTGDSKIDGSAALNTANVTVDATKTLTLDDVTATTDAFTDTGTNSGRGHPHADAQGRQLNHQRRHHQSWHHRCVRRRRHHHHQRRFHQHRRVAHRRGHAQSRHHHDHRRHHHRQRRQRPHRCHRRQQDRWLGRAQHRQRHRRRHQDAHAR